MIDLFFLLGAILFVGFFAYEFFQRTKIPDTLFLMVLGVLIGPVLGLVDTSPGSGVGTAAPFVGTVALIIILFDGGLNLKFFKVVSELKDAAGLTFWNFTFSTFLVGALMTFVYNWDPIHGVLLGSVLGGITSAVVLTTISEVHVSEDVKTVLSLESAFSDVLCVVTTVIIVTFLKSGSLDLRGGITLLSSAFSTAITTGIVFAIIWITVLREFKGRPFGYMLTLAVIFSLYSVTELIGGNGAIAALTFGLLLGNIEWIARRTKAKGDYALDKRLRQFQTEVSFFVRTFFFVYLGMMFNPYTVTPLVLWQASAVLLVILFARVISVKSFTRMDQKLNQSSFILITMLPRGLAAAVLSRTPEQSGILINNFPELVFLVIMLTNVVSTIGVFLAERVVTEGEKEK